MKARHALWLVLAAPGLYQLALLLVTVARRFFYPYDLEWMEGGMLVHAQRFLDGNGIYVPPSVDFVPFLYTPLYPALLAGMGKLVGLSYQLGRAVSVLSILAIIGAGTWGIWRESPRRGVALVGASVFAGVFASTYPWVEGWYDLVRGDTLFLAMGTVGLVLLRAWAHDRRRVCIAAALLALSFFAKQTGVLFVAAGGAALLVMNPRAVLHYTVTAGAIGGGGSLLLNKLTGGWYWIYVYKFHQQHDTNMERFWRSFANIVGRVPVLAVFLLVVAAAVASYAASHRRLPRGGAAFLYWLWLFVCGLVMGALGWATQWAHFNAYIPALTFGGLAGGAGVVALAACFEDLPSRWRVPEAFAAAAALALGWQLWHLRWEPRTFIPTRADAEAGDRLIARLAAIDGDVFIPSHPWYAHLAGKATHTHRMGIMDVTYTPPPEQKKPPLPTRAQLVDGLADGLKHHRWAAVVLDDHWQYWELPGLEDGYRRELTLPRNESPRVVTGAPTSPQSLWLPLVEAAPPPAGVKVIFDFETGTWSGWTVTGDAWGPMPVGGIPGFHVGGTRGRFFASSYGGGPGGYRAQGTLTSPVFTLAEPKLVLHLGGGGDEKAARAELRRADDDTLLFSATGPRGPDLKQIVWDVSALQGVDVKLVFVDEGTSGWDYLLVDDVWGAP